MFTEIIMELTKAEESVDVTSEQILGWAKRAEVQRAQSAIMDSLTETKMFDKIDSKRGTHIQHKKSASTCQSTHNEKLQLLWFQPSIKTIPGLWEEVCGLW